MVTIFVATDFSKFPAGRFYSDGEFSGQRFREEFLLPALRSSDNVKVILAGTKSYGSSFLEEAFGGLVRYGYFTSEQLAHQLEIEAGGVQYDIYKRRAEQYIRNAKFGSTEGPGSRRMAGAA
jgi:hypothetical protein